MLYVLKMFELKFVKHQLAVTKENSNEKKQLEYELAQLYTVCLTNFDKILNLFYLGSKYNFK